MPFTDDYLRKKEREQTAYIKRWCHLPAFPEHKQVAARIGADGEWFPLWIAPPLASFYVGTSRYVRSSWGGYLLCEKLAINFVVNAPEGDPDAYWPGLWITLKPDPEKPHLAIHKW